MQNLKRFYKYIALISIVTFFSCNEARAQRTAQGQFLFSGSFDYNMSSFGGEISAGQYLYFAYWAGGINIQNYAYEITGINQKANFLRLTPTGTFMYRILKTPSRSVNLYGGGDAFIGAEFLDVFAQLPNEVLKSLTDKGYKYTRLIYGGSLKLEGEFFPLRKLAIIVPLRLSFTGNTAMNEILGFNVGIGVRYNL